jgi:hypothetical protein
MTEKPRDDANALLDGIDKTLSDFKSKAYQAKKAYDQSDVGRAHRELTALGRFWAQFVHSCGWIYMRLVAPITWRVYRAMRWAFARYRALWALSKDAYGDPQFSKARGGNDDTRHHCRLLSRLLALGTLLFPAVTASAEVTRFEVLQSAPAFEGRSFGSVGPYVKITGRATIAVDPTDPRNAVIADIDKAPRNEKGLVEATADVVLLRPADPLRANGTRLVDIPNRGTKLAPQLFDDSAQPGANDAERAADAGIGFLHAQGYTMAWTGWQADIASKPGQLALAAPVLKGVTGPARDEFVFDHTRTRLPLHCRGRSRTHHPLRSPCERGGMRRGRAPQGLPFARPAPRRSRLSGPRAGSMRGRSTR